MGCRAGSRGSQFYSTSPASDSALVPRRGWWAKSRHPTDGDIPASPPGVAERTYRFIVLTVPSHVSVGIPYWISLPHIVGGIGSPNLLYDSSIYKFFGAHFFRLIAHFFGFLVVW